MWGQIKKRGGGIKSIPTGVYVATAPNKTSYKAGETLATAGMVVKVKFSDNTEKDITSECTFSPASGTVIYENTTKIDISWEWNELGAAIAYSTEQPITVQRVLSSIAVTTQPTKTTYYKNETLNLAGMVVKATFTSENTANITGWTTSPASGATLSTLGTQTVTVSYTENGVTKTATFTVQVNVKIVTWAAGTDAEIASMVEAADKGLIALSDYWTVGDERSVSLSAMAATGVGESHAAQTAKFVLMNAGGKDLAAATESGRTTCSFVVGLKDCLNEAGYMNSSSTNANGWDGCARRTWCNSVFRNAIPSPLRGIFKQHKNKASAGSGSSTIKTSNDYFALPAEIEVFGTRSYSASGEGSQFKYYETASNRIKNVNGSAADWWGRSPCSSDSTGFCEVRSYGYAGASGASRTFGLTPFGCI